MLLVHQVGSVRIGEVVRYTFTYTPSLDRILPSPKHLHVKIRNTSAIPLRAAYLVGPYTLYTACYPSTFDPNFKNESLTSDDVPDFESNLKAGGSWTSRLAVPEHIRETAGNTNVKKNTDGTPPSHSWVIEISAQIIFSTSAAVHFELLIGRDERSIELGFAALSSVTRATPGQLEDHQQSKRNRDGRHGAAQPKGVFSHAVNLVVDDTASLWNKPAFPEWEDEGPNKERNNKTVDPRQEQGASPTSGNVKSRPATNEDTKIPRSKKQKRIHLVVLTHGLHSNLGADMLYLKESIDAAARQATSDAKKRKRDQKKARTKPGPTGADTDDTTEISRESENTSSLTDSHTSQDEPGRITEEESDEEEVIVRGFPGNVCRTERGIQYLGKRLAKYILSITYPDQEYLPQKQSMKTKISRAFTGDQSNGPSGTPEHKHSSVYHPNKKPPNKAYKITSISFIAHSLGGLTQTYAIAYIHKHSPRFFDVIKPINFVTMAAPFLGLSNENPLYVKFALDFGLVGRTGQDLGLTWRAPTMVRSGWGAMIGGIGNEGQRARQQPDPGSKPLLRILPTGHTHHVLKQFRNRTVYSNVVNDGIVPLRTSCLLFLDWSALGRVEKSRRENGLIGTTLGWGWAELTGANSSSRKNLRADHESERWSQSDVSGEEASDAVQAGSARAEVPQPAADATKEDNAAQERKAARSRSADGGGKPFQDEAYDATKDADSSPQQPAHPISGLLSFLRPNPQKSHHHPPKNSKIYHRSQTINGEQAEGSRSPADDSPSDRRSSPGRPGLVRGESVLNDPEHDIAPPKTTIFESAGDVLSPPLPTRNFIVDPQSRPRTIFHDRIYHPEDIPPPPTKRELRLTRSISSESKVTQSRSLSVDSGSGTPQADFSSMKVEEKIARAYHHGLSWRKVLVRLEPDAHNNMVVRRMFANAYGWPVVKHLVDTHFSDSYAAATADSLESNTERAKPLTEHVDEDGAETNTPIEAKVPDIKRTDSEKLEANDSIGDLKRVDAIGSKNNSYNNKPPILSRQDSAQWNDALFDISDGSDSEDDHAKGTSSGASEKAGTSDAEISDFLSKPPLPADSPEEQKGGASFPGSGVGTSTVGLGRSVEEQLHITTPGG